MLMIQTTFIFGITFKGTFVIGRQPEDRYSLFKKRQIVDETKILPAYEFLSSVNQSNVQSLDSYEWTSESDHFKIIFDYNCSYIDQHSIVQSYTFSNGSASASSIQYRDVMADEFDIRHSSERYRDAIIRHWLMNAKAIHAKLEDLLIAQRPPDQSENDEHNELGRLLVGWEKAILWVAYVSPQAIIPSLVGWGIVAGLDWWQEGDDSSKSLLTKDQFQTWLVIFATAFAGALTIQLEKVVLGPQEDFLSQRNVYVIRACIIWLGNVWSWLIAGSWRYSSIGDVSYVRVSNREMTVLNLDPDAAGRPKVFVDGVVMQSRFQQLASVMNDQASSSAQGCS